MSTLGNPTPPGWTPGPPTLQSGPGASVMLTQQQWQDLMERLSVAEQKTVTAKAPPAWWMAISNWAASQGGWIHAAAIAYGSFAAWVAADPQARMWFIGVWADMPKKLVDAVAIFGPPLLLYMKSYKATVKVAQAE